MPLARDRLHELSAMISIVDYGAGNIGSVINMIRKAGGQAAACASADDLSRAEKILLPGVGSFDNAVNRLNGLGLVDALLDRAQAGVPLLGICLGMQLLANASDEGRQKGLGLIPGQCPPLPIRQRPVRI